MAYLDQSSGGALSTQKGKLDSYISQMKAKAAKIAEQETRERQRKDPKAEPVTPEEIYDKVWTSSLP